jgi:hypothetical protein
MKFLFSTAFLLFLGVFTPVFAQTEAQPVDKYAVAFKKALQNLDSSWASPVKMRETAGQFERLANFKKDDWLPRYYQVLCLIQLSYTVDAKEREAILKTAEGVLKSAQEISKDNSELVALEGFMYQAMILINVMTNGPIYAPKSNITLQKAAELDPKNPRPHYLMGSNLYFTPAQWGGGADKARPHLEKAKALFATFTPASDRHPNWGSIICDMMLEGKIKTN